MSCAPAELAKRKRIIQAGQRAMDQQTTSYSLASSWPPWARCSSTPRSKSRTNRHIPKQKGATGPAKTRCNARPRVLTTHPACGVDNGCPVYSVYNASSFIQIHDVNIYVSCHFYIPLSPSLSFLTPYDLLVMSYSYSYSSSIPVYLVSSDGGYLLVHPLYILYHVLDSPFLIVFVSGRKYSYIT